MILLGRIIRIFLIIFACGVGLATLIMLGMIAYNVILHYIKKGE